MYTEDQLDVYNECMFLEAKITFKPRFMGMDEAQDIKDELREIKRLNDMTDEELYKNRNKVWKFCAHLLQLNFDIAMVNSFVAIIFLPPIGVVALLINRLLRSLSDDLEIKNEIRNVEKLISQLKSKRSSASPREKKRIDASIKRLQKIVDKY